MAGIHRSALCAQLDSACVRFLTRYQSWRRPVSQYSEANFNRINQGGFTFSDFERGMAEIEARLPPADNPFPDFHAVLDTVCTAYLHADPAERSAIRQVVAGRDSGAWVRHYADQLAKQLTSPDSELLRRAIAAVSIENCASDYRDTITSLADLYVRAEELGIDPRPHFAAIAELSDDQPTPGGCDSFAKMLLEFEKYAVVAERRRMGTPYRNRNL